MCLRINLLFLGGILLFANPGMVEAASSGRGGGKSKTVAPSENKGRTGSYFEVKTSFPGNQYHVYVPSTYSDTNPAGIHLFFHGQSVCSENKQFERWAKFFLEPFNLIGINMQYLDGNNMKETEVKMRAAVEAVLQVEADYKIILGRGIICSFSGGGGPHLAYAKQYAATAKTPTPEWPFQHLALYGSNYYSTIMPPRPMSAFVGLGEKEWTMGKPSLGKDMPARAAEMFQLAAAGTACWDIFFNYTKDKEHTFTDEDLERSAAQFRRSDLAFSPFLYEPDYPKDPLKKIVVTANKLELGNAAKAIATLLAKEGVDPEVRTRAEAIAAAIEARVEAIFTLSRELAEKDPLLLTYYGPIFAAQLKTHPRAKEYEEILQPIQKEKAKWQKLFKDFAKEFGTLLNASGKLNPGKEKILTTFREAAGAESTLGQMITRLLDFQ